MSSPPRIGSGQVKTGLRTRSEEWPSAWFVEDPSKPQIGSASRPAGPPVMIFVLERSLAVGWVPSIQMYSALKVTSHFLRGVSYALAGAAALRHWGTALVAREPVNRRFPGHCSNVNPVLPAGAVARLTV